MTEQLNNTSKQLEFLYKLRDEDFKEDEDSSRMIINIISSILGYQTYLQYIKDYEEKEIKYV